MYVGFFVDKQLLQNDEIKFKNAIYKQHKLLH